MGVYQRYKRSQRFNLVDLSAYFLAGPLGATVTKGMDFANILKAAPAPELQTQLPQLSSSWAVNEGHVLAKISYFLYKVCRTV